MFQFYDTGGPVARKIGDLASDIDTAVDSIHIDDMGHGGLPGRILPVHFEVSLPLYVRHPRVILPRPRL